MSGIFDLTNIKTLIEKARPSAAIIVDTNIIMQESDFSNWKTSFEKPLYVLPCMMSLELEHLKNKPESRDGANTATRNIAEICQEGHIAEGIYREGTGWFVATPPPDGEALESGLEQLSSLVKVLGQVDTELVILAKEMVQAVSDIPIIFATADKNLFNAVQFIGINSFLFQGFPMKEMEKTALTLQPKAVDWDDILEDIQVVAARRMVGVDLTLISKGCAPKWVTERNDHLHPDPVIIAEGTGVIHAVVDIRFSWTLPFAPWDFPALNVFSADSPEPGRNGEAGLNHTRLGLGTAHLDFGGLEQTVSPNLRNALVKKINNCASPLAYIEDMPTLQDPASVMKQFFLFEFIFQERGFENRIPRESLDEFEKKLKNYNNLLNWAFYWLYDRKTTREDLNISFGEFLQALRSCWAIGETIRIDLLTEQAELSNIQGEAGE